MSQLFGRKKPESRKVPVMVADKTSQEAGFAILELDALTQQDKIFFVEALLLWIHHRRMIEKQRETFKHAILIEEAHHIFSDERRSLVGGQSVMDIIFREIREFGESLILLDQHPSKISLYALKPAEEELNKALTAFHEAEGRKREVDELAALRRADFDYYNNKLHLEQLEERKDRMARARQLAVEAEKLLARNKVDALTLKAIHEAERGLLTAEAQRETGAPNVLLRGLAECRLQAGVSKRDEVIRRNMKELVDSLVTDPDLLPIEAAEQMP
jgi:hypothetical protein